MSNRDIMMAWLMANPFKDNGGSPLTRAQAAAIAGNIQAESGFGFNVTEGHKMDGASNEEVDAWTKTGPRGLGVVQWTWNPGRAGNLIALARSLGKQWYEAEVQFHMIRNEMDGGYGARLARAGFFTAGKKPGELAIIFHDIYEGSADTATMKQRRAQFAEAAYASTTEGETTMATYANGQVPRSVMKAFRNTGKYGHPDFINRLDAAFTAVSRELGINLYIGSGQDIFRDYETQVYWKKYWTGKGKPGNAASPGFSNHGLGVCADISPMPGRGTTRFNQIANIFARWNLRFNVASENWHVQDMNISVVGNKVTINGSSNGDFSGNKYFPSLAAFAAVQGGYRAIGYNITADGRDGPKTQAAVKDFQRKHGLTPDGVHGPATEAALIAAQPKPSAPAAPAFPLSGGKYFGPKSGGANSISGYFGASNKANLKKWQQRMKDRGWDIAVDGLYGDGTARVAKAFQKQLGLKQDGLIGGATWSAAWTAPVT